MTRRIAVVGGGPGGAFAARLLKLAEPSWTVDLYEEHPALETFGFGVGLSVSAQHSLGRGDPETFAAIDRAAHRGHGMRMYADSGSVRMPGNDTMAIARATLLQILYRQAEAAGVRVTVGGRVDSWALDADVVIAADGVNSPTRTSCAEDFGVRVVTGRQRYIWCGTDHALPDALFAPVRTEHGVFTVHAYPYRGDRSTFLVETDEATWRAAGFEHTSEGLAPGRSDEVALDYLQEAFAEHLGGARLLGNNSRWTRFRTVRCASWSSGPVVLLGDAAHTAHYSVGSGTKLAMEDAIVLAESLAGHADTAEAFAVYQRVRQPSVERLQELADRSQLWWEAYTRRLGMPAERLLASFLTRAGNVALSEFRAREPKLAEAALSQYAGTTPPDSGEQALQSWVFAQPLKHGELSLPSREAGRAGVALAHRTCDLDDPRDARADAFVAACAEAAVGVELDGPATRAGVLRRLDVAERLVHETGLLTSVRAPAEFSADLAAGLVAGRTHLISVS
ncbi:FAD-dependent monooxygenase [Actinocorallia sp. A-T 12471]|uniref:FAD-dependent monooxygenase n=1 Tax=Actinocorallia sp. A-T 12471 TaxID=3089813 RepID=UPI0029D2AA13|nr:FAD-dependent monooxygenase [Actinocorallia sp. A-T 12471]MDX6741683.1 FAD-dependent monooxygenase [Actinocorallia sp. A-T 12471]